MKYGSAEAVLYMSYLGVNGGGEVAEQPDVVLLTRLHVHHQTGVQVPESRGLSKRLVQHHLPIRRFTGNTHTHTHGLTPELPTALTSSLTSRLRPGAGESPGFEVVQQVVSNLRLFLVKFCQHVEQHREAAVVFLHGDEVPEDQTDWFTHRVLQRPAGRQTGGQRETDWW